MLRSLAPTVVVALGCGSAGAPAVTAPPVQRAAAEPLLGAFPSIEAYCETLAPNEDSGEGAHCAVADDGSLQSGVQTGPQEVSRSGTPYREVRIFATEDLDMYCNLAIRLADGWYVQENVIDCGSERASADIAIFARELAVRDVVRGGRPEILFRYSVVVTDPECESRCPEERTNLRVVCGLGASGVPSCTGALADDRPPSTLEVEFP